MTISWILGWAVPTPWFAEQVQGAFPQGEHRYIPAGPSALNDLAAIGPRDWIVGYSLGAQLLLLDPGRVAGLGHVALLAPIWSLPAEDGLGGRVARAQIRALAQWLRRDAPAALDDFYDRAELGLAAGPELPASREQLLWGLNVLEKQRVDGGLPPRWRAWCGEHDALLDARRLAAQGPDVRVVAGAGHAPGPLLAALAAAVAAEGEAATAAKEP